MRGRRGRAGGWEKGGRGMGDKKEGRVERWEGWRGRVMMRRRAGWRDGTDRGVGV